MFLHLCQFPIFTQVNTKQRSQADVPLQIQIRVVNLLQALDLGRLMRVIGVDHKGKSEDTALVDAFVRSNSEFKIEDVVGVWKDSFHCRGKVEFSQVWY